MPMSHVVSHLPFSHPSALLVVSPGPRISVLRSLSRGPALLTLQGSAQEPLHSALPPPPIFLLNWEPTSPAVASEEQ